MAGQSIPPEVREAIFADVQAGMGQKQVAKKYGVGAGSVNRIAHGSTGKDIPRSMEQAGTRPQPPELVYATKVRQDYTMENRRKLMNRVLDRAWDMLGKEYLTAQELRFVSVSVAIMVDKLRLEEGEPTGREEHIVHGSSALDEFTSRIVSLADRRRTS